MPEKTNPEDDLFEEALQKASGPERSAFLESACRNQPDLRARLEMMLEGHLHADGFLETAPERVPPRRTMACAEGTELEQLGARIGPYKLLQKIGEGGCGSVYMAEQTEPVRRRVALKVIKLGMDTRSVIARFEAEQQALALMDHPNIARVFDAGATQTGRPYFVMELVRGIKITEYCDQNHLTTGQRLSLLIQVCQAIQHAHQKGIIHRDIKPSNILVTLHDGVPVPKVIDFGIAKATCEQRLTDKTVFTAFEQFLGTPAYMSPEQAEMSGLDIDTRSDIYSLGVLLYELLTGSTPFDAGELLASGLEAMRKTIREKEPAHPSTKFSTLQGDDLATTAQRRSTEPSKLLHQLKGDLDWIIMKCLEKDRTRRYETANGLAADLKRHLSDEPVVARPPSTAYRFQKAYRRNKLVFAAGAAVVGALVAGLTLAAIGWRQTRVERDKAIQARTEAEASEQKAIEAGQRAHAGEQEARRAAAHLRRTAYVGDMALVHQAIGEGNLGRAKSLLARYVPKPSEDDIRGFEWRYLWTQARSEEVARLGQYGGWLGGLAISPDGIYLASVAPQGIEIRSLQNHALILALTNAGRGPIQFSPDSQSLVTVRDGGLALWNTRTWKQETELPRAREPFAFAQNGKVIVAGLDDHLALWSTEKASKIADLPGSVSFYWASAAMAISPDGNTVFFGDGSQIRSWDLRTHIEWEPMSYPLGGWATFLAVSPDGLLAAAHWNGHVTLWDFKAHQLLHTFGDHLTWVSSVVFSPDGVSQFNEPIVLAPFLGSELAFVGLLRQRIQASFGGRIEFQRAQIPHTIGIQATGRRFQQTVVNPQRQGTRTHGSILFRTTISARRFPAPRRELVPAISPRLPSLTQVNSIVASLTFRPIAANELWQSEEGFSSDQGTLLLCPKAMRPPNHFSVGGKLGRNDPCPSGAGVKFKKCLLAHPQLALDSSTSEIWWACDRWQATAPSEFDLLQALSKARPVSGEKLKNLEQRVFAAPPEGIPWELVLSRFMDGGHADVLGLFTRIVDRVGQTDLSKLWMICQVAVEVAGTSHADLLAAVTEIYCREGTETPDSVAVSRLHGLLRAHKLIATADALRTRFPQWVPSVESPASELEQGPALLAQDPGETLESEPSEKSADERRADKIWAEYSQLKSPSVEQMNALVEALMALPADLAEWNGILTELDRRGHPDLIGIYRRVMTEVKPVASEFAFVHWWAVETFVRRNQPDLIPEVAAHFTRLDDKTYDADALFRILDLLQFHGLGRTALELGEHFLPIVGADKDVTPSTPSHLAWRVFELRLGERILLSDRMMTPSDCAAADLRKQLEEWVSPEAAQRAAVTLADPGESVWSRAQFNLRADSAASEEESRDVALGYLETQIRFVREVFRQEQQVPSLTWLGLEGIWRMLTTDDDRRRTPSSNLLDYLVTAGMERRIARSCPSIMGTDVPRAIAMIHTLASLVRLTARRELIPVNQAATVEKLLDRLVKKLKDD